MRSEYDALLSWPFRQCVTICLIDRRDERRQRLADVRTAGDGRKRRVPQGDNVTHDMKLYVRINV